MLGELTLSTNRGRSRQCFLACQALEERLVPATVLVTTDTDGDGANDTVYDFGTFLHIVHNNGTPASNYQLGTAWTFVSTSPANTDGVAGNELVFRLGNGKLRFIHDAANGKTIDYDLGPSTFLLTSGTMNADAGTDMVFQVPQGIRIINDAKKVVHKYNLNGPWAQLSGAPTNLDFDQETELVFTVPGGIRVINDSPGRSTFYALPGPWTLLATGDFDGKTQNTTTATDMAFAVPAGLRIVHEASRTMSKFSSSTGFWKLAALGTGTAVSTTTETDGVPGAELIFDTGDGKIVIVSDATHRVAGYFVGTGFSLITNPVDTDGKAGNELVIKVNGMVRILRNASRTAKTYTLGPAWTFLNATEVDGNPGMDLRFQVGAKVLVIYDAKETVETAP